MKIIKKFQRGEIATILTLISMGLMVAGVVVGRVAVKQTAQLRTQAYEDKLVTPTPATTDPTCIYNDHDDCKDFGCNPDNCINCGSDNNYKFKCTAGPAACPVNRIDVNNLCNPACCGEGADCPQGEACGVPNGHCKSGKSCAQIVPSQIKPLYVRTCQGALCAWTFCDGKNTPTLDICTDNPNNAKDGNPSTLCDTHDECKTLFPTTAPGVSKCIESSISGQSLDCPSKYNECISSDKARIVHRDCTQSNTSGCNFWCESKTAGQKTYCGAADTKTIDAPNCKSAYPPSTSTTILKGNKCNFEYPSQIFKDQAFDFSVFSVPGSPSNGDINFYLATDIKLNFTKKGSTTTITNDTATVMKLKYDETVVTGDKWDITKWIFSNNKLDTGTYTVKVTLKHEGNSTSCDQTPDITVGAGIPLTPGLSPTPTIAPLQYCADNFSDAKQKCADDGAHNNCGGKPDQCSKIQNSASGQICVKCDLGDKKYPDCPTDTTKVWKDKDECGQKSQKCTKNTCTECQTTLPLPGPNPVIKSYCPADVDISGYPDCPDPNRSWGGATGFQDCLNNTSTCACKSCKIGNIAKFYCQSDPLITPIPNCPSDKTTWPYTPVGKINCNAVFACEPAQNNSCKECMYGGYKWYCPTKPTPGPTLGSGGPVLPTLPLNQKTKFVYHLDGIDCWLFGLCRHNMQGTKATFEITGGDVAPTVENLVEEVWGGPSIGFRLYTKDIFFTTGRAYTAKIVTTYTDKQKAGMTCTHTDYAPPPPKTIDATTTAWDVWGKLTPDIDCSAAPTPTPASGAGPTRDLDVVYHVSGVCKDWTFCDYNYKNGNWNGSDSDIMAEVLYKVADSGTPPSYIALQRDWNFYLNPFDPYIDLKKFKVPFQVGKTYKAVASFKYKNKDTLCTAYKEETKKITGVDSEFRFEYTLIPATDCSNPDAPSLLLGSSNQDFIIVIDQYAKGEIGAKEVSLFIRQLTRSPFQPVYCSCPGGNCGSCVGPVYPIQGEENI